jgi:hypothetical protein
LFNASATTPKSLSSRHTGTRTRTFVAVFVSCSVKTLACCRYVLHPLQGLMYAFTTGDGIFRLPSEVTSLITRSKSPVVVSWHLSGDGPVRVVVVVVVVSGLHTFSATPFLRN